MSIGIWENLNFNLNEFICTRKGFLRAENGNFLLYRDDEGKLKLKVEGILHKDSNFTEKSGYIDKNESLIVFGHKWLKQKVIMYALPINRNHSLGLDNARYTDIFIVDEIVFEDSHESIGAEYLIEFVDNLKINHILPHSFNWEETHKKSYEIYGTDCQIIQNLINQKHSNRNSIGFKVEEDEIYIIKTDEGNKGIILYKKNLDLEKREKIRKIISYILGCPLVYYGYTFINKYMISSFSYSKNINSNEKNLLNINFQLPTALDFASANIINEKIFQNLVIEIFQKYDAYDFGNIVFNYWIAVGSNSITAAVLHGAIVEKLQSKYMEINNVSYSKVLDRSAFKKLKQKLELQFDDFEISDDQKKIFLNKIGNMNTYSQKDKMNFFCQDVSLTLSEIENKAWQQRNDAAHGNDITDYNEAWKNTLILRELVNKFLLRLLTSSEYYLSYLQGNPIIKKL